MTIKGKEEVRLAAIHDLEGAQKMLDQALMRLHPSLDLYKELKRVDDELDSIVDALREGDYDIKAKA